MSNTTSNEQAGAMRQRIHQPKPIPDIDDLPDEALITRRQLSVLSGYAITTLKIWARAGRGPNITVVEGRPRYKAIDVRNWINAAA
ncbi:MAG: hypothetical protein JOZ16_09920 [Methylobacteriaceae bacterium]|nr:hypothetical protein [Methylobacteriaceae bacterium]